LRDANKSREELLEELRATRAVLKGAEEALLRAREVLGRRLQAPEADRLFRVFAEHSRDLICICDLRGLRTYVSPSYRAVLGYEPEELLGESILSLAHPQDLSSVAGELQEGLGEVEPGMYRTRSRHADGRYVWLEAQVSPLLDEEGKVDGGLFISRDVTERMAFEESLRASEEEYRNLVETAGAGVVSTDLEWRFNYVNPTFREMLGYAESELIGRNFSEFLFPDDVQEVMAVFDNALAAPEGRFGLEFRVVHKDGGTIHCYTNPTATRFEGETVGFQAIIQDVTARVLAKQSLAESEEKYRLLVENQTDLVVKVDTEGRFLFVSPSYCEMFGMEEEELLGQAFMPLVHEDDQEATAKAMEDLYRPPYRAHVEQRAHIRDGWRWLAWADTAVLDDEDKIVAIIGVGRDVTGRKKAEEALHKAQALLEETGRMAKVGGWELDVATAEQVWTMETCRIHQVDPDFNPNLEKGISFYSPEAQSVISEAVRQAIDDGKPFDVELPFITARGNHLWVRAIGRALQEGGMTRKVYGTFQDITERRRYEVELEESERSLRALAARLQEVREEERTSIALELHDQLGQALTGLKIDLAWLRRHIREHPPTEQDLILGKMESMSGLLDSTVRDVRRLSADLRPSLLDDFGLVPAMEWLAQDFSERTGVHCRLVAEPEDLDLEKGVSTALYRVVQESLTNVARHAAATRVSVKLKRKEKELVLEVSDNGAGIPEEKIGDQFSLGLLGIRERVTGLGGKLKIAGKEGKGTRVTVRLPLPVTAPGRPDQGREDG
jgi:PAS domain S-box-containing protein